LYALTIILAVDRRSCC